MLIYITRLPPTTEEKRADGPYAVVLVPTRELARQIDNEIRKLASYIDINVESVIRGQPIEEQADKLARGCQVIIATPGRLPIALRGGMSSLASKYLKNPVVSTIGTSGKATDLITQHVIMVKETEKMHWLQKLLNDLGDKTAIVFVNTKKSADMRAKDLDMLGYSVTTLHGGKLQEQREVSLDGFRDRRFKILVATHVAGRGIDVPDVAHVVNYDMPNTNDLYTHRIGRTGHAGKTGVATTFVTLHDTNVFYDLKQMLIQSNSLVPPELARHEASKFKPGSIPDRPLRRNDTIFIH